MNNNKIDIDTLHPVNDLDKKEHLSEVVKTAKNVQEEPGGNRRIAKNAVMLYLRMFLTMIVGLYTSRVVLDVLGVEDYGIYGVVGGVVAMLGFLNASMSGATSRFLTFELGRGDKKRLADTFSSALIVHIIIAVVVFIVAETVGLWFLTHKLVIPEGRMPAAYWVYQCSIVSAMLSITQVPYNATIIAHEKMDVYAYVEILNVTLKLLIVYLLTIGNFDKLKLYAVLGLAVSVIVITVYRIYCVRNFEETHFRFMWKPNLLKPLISFSAWNLYGNFGGVFQQQGTNFVINVFYGVVMNAAVSVGLTVANVVNLFATNVMVAFRPQIIKNYSQGRKDEMRDLTILALKVIMMIFCLVGVAVYIEVDQLLNLWLVEVPKHSATICRLFLISIFFETIRYILIIDIHATGNVKLVSFASGTIFILVPFLIYGLFRLGLTVNAALVVVIMANFILGLVNVMLVKHYVRINVRPYILAIIQIVVASGLSLIGGLYISRFIPSNYIHMITNALIAASLVVTSYFLLCFNAAQRRLVLETVKKKLNLG